LADELQFGLLMEKRPSKNQAQESLQELSQVISGCSATGVLAMIDRFDVKNLRGPSRALLAPLYFRAVESRRDEPIVRDEQADGLIRKLDFDFTVFDADPITQVATVLRTKRFDEWTEDFLSRNRGGVVVNIGCGLDTRFYRVDDGVVRWFDLDLPDVIRLRQNLLDESERCRCIGCSALDPSWMQEVSDPAPQAILFLAEGVFPYLEQVDTRRLVGALIARFPGSQLIFDAVSPLQAALSVFHPSLSILGARFRWGLASGNAAERWVPGLRLLREDYYLDRPLARLGWLAFFLLLPQVSRGFVVLEYKLGGSES
jgi:O-methyltransferase involved in polyketide biosynthesis